MELNSNLDFGDLYNELNHPVITSNTSTLIEITERCYTNCQDYCYKCGVVSPAGNHVDIDTLKQRIDWIEKYVQSTGIGLIGGEPLSHPGFQEIAEYILGKDLPLSIITSGKTSPQEKSNLDVLLDLYASGDIMIDVSYHPGKNEKEFKYLYGEFHKLYSKRKSSLEDKFKQICDDETKDKKDVARMHDILKGDRIYTTITLSEENTKEFQLFEIAKFLYGDCIGDNLTKWSIDVDGKEIDFGKYFRNLSRELGENFSHFKSSKLQSGSITTTRNSNFDYVFKMWTATGIKPTLIEKDGTIVESRAITRPKGAKPSGAICSAMTSKYDDKTQNINLGSLLIRTDGECTFSEPACISSRSQFGNIDELVTREDVYNSFSSQLKWIQTIIRETKAARAKNKSELCRTDPNFKKKLVSLDSKCYSCQFDLSCNICNSVKRSELPETTDEIELVREWIPIVEKQILK